MQITGKVVARNVSSKELTKKDGGKYKTHSFMLEVPSSNSNYPDHYAFKTVQSNVIAEIRKGYEVEVEFSIESRGLKTEDKTGFKLVEDTFSGAELYKCFVTFYASGVKVLDSSNNEEDIEEHNRNFVTQVVTPPSAVCSEPDDDLPF